MALRKVGNGVYIDPETGELSGTNTSIISNRGISQSYTRSNYTSRRRSNLWNSFDNFIIDIGNWFARNGESVQNYIGFGLYIIAWIGFAVAVINTWIEEGFIWALLMGIFGGGIFYWVSTIALGIFIWVMTFVMMIIRYIFYSAVPFLISIAIIVCTLIPWSNFAQTNYSKQQTVIETPVQPQTSKYYCTASSGLNIRYSPNANSKVIGLLPKGKMIDVYEISSNGFAKVSYNGQVGYASAKYLKKY